MITVRSFTNDLLASLNRTEDDRRILARVYDVPLNHVIKTVETTDRCGIDYLVALPTGPRAVDFKYRSAGAARYWRSPDVEELGIELRGPLVTGRTAAQDYYAYFEDTGWGYLLSVPALMVAVCERLSPWRMRYGVRQTHTGNDSGGSTATPVCYVPLPVVLDAIRTVTHSENEPLQNFRDD